MKVKSYITEQKWLEERAAAILGDFADQQTDDGVDTVRKEITRVLFDLVHTRNLVVLAGPGAAAGGGDGQQPAANDSHASFLRRLARRSNRLSRLKLFTTSPDRSFEDAADRGGFVVMDGFTLSNPSRFDPAYFDYDVVRRGTDPDAPDYIENLFHLYKIHGSVDWEYDEGSRHVWKFPGTNKPLVIDPHSTVLGQPSAQPYLETMSAFQTAIRQRDVGLLVVGFDFADDHIADPVLTAIETNLALKVTVIAPGAGEQSASNPYLKEISGLIDQGDARLAMIDAEFEEIVPMLPGNTALTDLERHADRVRAIREE